MALTVQVSDVLSRIRVEADIETSDQANSIVTDATLLAWLNDAYRELYEILAAECGQEYFGKSAIINHSTGAVPTDFWRLLGIDWAPDGTTVSAHPYNFGERNRQNWILNPVYRLDGDVITWQPVGSTPTTDYTLRYVPTPATLASNGSFDSILGWDTFVILWVKLKVLAKQEYPLDDVGTELNRCERRIHRQACRLSQDADTIEDIRGTSPEWYYNG